VVTLGVIKGMEGFARRRKYRNMVDGVYKTVFPAKPNCSHSANYPFYVLSPYL
jgi:hypothetical protein